MAITYLSLSKIIKMKKIVLSLLTLITVVAQAQTAEEIIGKYTAACGGLDAFNKITSAKMTGTVAIQSMDFPVTMEILNGKGMRMDVDAMGQTVTNAYYNGKAWQVNPFQGITAPTEVNGSELLSMKTQASLANGLLDYKNRGHQVTLAGEEKVEGVNTYKIILTHKEDGKKVNYFISATDFTLIKTSSTREIQGQQMEVENWYADYKLFGGAKIAMHVIQKISGEVSQDLSWSNIELGVTIDPKKFEM